MREVARGLRLRGPRVELAAPSPVRVPWLAVTRGGGSAPRPVLGAQRPLRAWLRGTASVRGPETLVRAPGRLRRLTGFSAPRASSRCHGRTGGVCRGPGVDWHHRPPGGDTLGARESSDRASELAARHPS